MTKTVLDVGNCDPDHSALKAMLSRSYDVTVLRAHQLDDTLATIRQQPVDLVLINRKLDVDYSDGTEILKKLRQCESSKNIPVMLITNYPEHQQAAVAEGALYGFGKLQYSEPATHERLSQILEKKPSHE
jgi:response regulator RpfG family c-di-GMP phosphodiesterase